MGVVDCYHSIQMAFDGVTEILKKTDEIIHLCELDKVKVPYASKHCIGSGFIGLEMQALCRDARWDDKMIYDP